MIDLLDHDKALLTILYTASGNPVLVNTITLWQRSRAYKTAFAQGRSTPRIRLTLPRSTLLFN